MKRIASVLLAAFAPAAWAGPVEITAGNDVTISSTPAETEAYALMGGNLTISGSGTTVQQNVPVDNTTSDGTDFGAYWPWASGTVTVENGAILESDTQLFRGSGVSDNANRTLLRKLVVQSGATAIFTPANGEAYLVGLENSGYDNAWAVVTGAGSTLTLPANVYLGNKSDFAGHGGGMDILDGGHVEMGTFYVGYHCGTLRLNIDGGSLKVAGGIYGFKNGSRWTGATILFKDCVIETPFYKMAYPHGNGGSTVTFDGAVFKPVGTPAAKFVDASPTGDPRCPHVVTGGGLAVDAPAGASLEVSALLQGDGGFTKLGAGAVALTADNAYTGATTVSNGTLRLAGSLAGPVAVAPGATLALPVPAAGGAPLEAASLAVADGASLAAVGSLPAGAAYAGVLRSAGPISIPDLPPDAAGHVFFVATVGGVNELRYGDRTGIAVSFR